jgi:hypothetical protein
MHRFTYFLYLKTNDRRFSPAAAIRNKSADIKSHGAVRTRGRHTESE